MVIRNIFDSSLDKASSRDDTHSDERRHEIDFAIGEARSDVVSTLEDLQMVHMLGSAKQDQDLLFTNARTAAFAERNERLLQLVIWLTVAEQPSLRNEIVGVREKVLVPMIDHGSHSDRGTTGDDPLDVSVLALVYQVFVASNAGGAVRHARHHSEGLMNDSPQVGLLLEFDPLEVGRVDFPQVFHEAGVDAWLIEQPVCDDREGGLVRSTMDVTTIRADLSRI